MSGRVLITGAAGALGRSVVQRFLDGDGRVLAVVSAIHFLTTSVPGRTL